MGERVAHARGLFSRNSAENGKDSYGMQDLAAWRETLMIHARGLFSRKGANGAKEFLRNAGLGGLGGLARDSSRRFFVLAKAQRTQ